MKLNRRCFLKAARAAGLGASSVLTQSGTRSDIQSKVIISEKAAISFIRVARIKVYPQEGEMEADHRKLMDVLRSIEDNEDVDVVVTPEGFLDGYVSTEESVTKEDMVKYAIDPLSSVFALDVSEWGGRNKA